MTEEIKKHINKAYDCLMVLTVSGANVKTVALAEMELEEAYKALLSMEQAEKGEGKEAETDGQDH